MTSEADWVQPEHRTSLKLAEAYYTEPLQSYDGWVLKTGTRRVGVYQKGNKYIVVCKGTTVTDPDDIIDDLKIGKVLPGELGLAAEAREVVKMLKSEDADADIEITGHSLGGRVALEIAAEEDLKATVFNPAAPVVSPLTKGPGNDKAVSYHVVGDSISSHVDPKAAKVVNVDMDYTILQTAEAHTLGNFYSDKPAKINEPNNEKLWLSGINTAIQWGLRGSRGIDAFKQFADELYTPTMKALPLDAGGMDIGIEDDVES